MQIFVIARVTPGTPMEKVMPLIRSEATHVWEAYISEQIRQIYYLADMSGVIMLWEAESAEWVTQQLHSFPMVQEGFLTCEILPLKPYSGYASLFS